jgi:hypothetical protein
MCCFQDRKSLGNILQTSLEDMWNGPIAQAIRQTTSKGSLHKTCQVFSCPFFHKKEQAMSPIQLSKFPIELELDLPNQHCNIGGENPTSDTPACLMCERHLDWVRQEDRLQEICARIRPYVQYLRNIHIQGVAEAFWKDRFFEILEWLDLPPGQDKVRVSTATNGISFSESRRKKFLGYPLSFLCFSVDAATPETYKLIRRVDMFEKLKGNLLAYSRERNPNGQKLIIHNNINLLNINEVVGMVELAAQANCHIDFNPTYAAPAICVDQWNASLFKKAQDDIVEAASRLGVSVSFLRSLTLDFEVKPLERHVVSSNDLTRPAKILGVPPKLLLKYMPKEREFQVPVL